MPPLGGAGTVIFISAEKKLRIKYDIGQATNNKAELAALWVVLRVALSRQILYIQIFGDSKMVVDWANGRNNIRAPLLQHLLTEIQNLKDQIGRISCAHIYRELNEEADILSK